MSSVTRNTGAPFTMTLGSVFTDPGRTEMPGPRTVKFESFRVASKPAPPKIISTDWPEAAVTGPARTRVATAPPTGAIATNGVAIEDAPGVTVRFAVAVAFPATLTVPLSLVV